MFDNVQNSSAVIPTTSANESAQNGTTPGNPLDKTPNDSNLKPNEPHQPSAHKFDAGSANRSQWSDSWKATFPLRAGHFLLGILGVAAFRAAYIKARGSIGDDRVGRMQVRFDPGLKQCGQKAGERTFQQARIASSAQGWGASLAAPVSLVAALVGGFCGLGARARRAYQLWRLTDDVYPHMRDAFIAAAIQRSHKPNDTASNDRVIEEVVRKSVDSWRARCRNRSAPRVTREALRQKIEETVKAFGDIATKPVKEDKTKADFAGLVDQWSKCGRGQFLDIPNSVFYFGQEHYIAPSDDNQRKDGYLDDVARLVEDWTVRKHIWDCGHNADQGSAPELKLTRKAFDDSYEFIVEEVCKPTEYPLYGHEPIRTPYNSLTRSRANDMKDDVFQKLQDRPLYQIMTNLE